MQIPQTAGAKDDDNKVTVCSERSFTHSGKLIHSFHIKLPQWSAQSLLFPPHLICGLSSNRLAHNLRPSVSIAA